MDSSKRILRTRKITNAETGKTTTYLFRATPSYANSAAVNKSVVEVYALDADSKPFFVSVLDAATLADILSLSKVEFNLVDIVIWGNGEIFLLDQFNGVYVVNFNGDGTWTYKWTLPKYGAQAFAFAANIVVDSPVNNIAVLYYDYFALYTVDANGQSQSVKIYDLPFLTESYPPESFGLSQGHIFVEGENSVLYYSTASNKLITTGAASGDIFFLLNPFINNLVTLTAEEAQAWNFGEAKLLLNGGTAAVAQTSLKLQATSTQDDKTATCEVAITFQVLKDDDSSLIPLKEAVDIPSVISFPSESAFKLAGMVSGPDVQYQQKQVEQGFLQESKTTIKTYQLQSLQVTGDSIPAAADVVFSDLIVNADDPNKYYHVVQTKANQLQVWQCVLPSTSIIPSDQATCEPISVLKDVTKPITRATFQPWVHFDQFIYAYLKNDYQLDIVVSDDGEATVSHSINYDNTDEKNKITSFTFLEDYLYLVLSGS